MCPQHSARRVRRTGRKYDPRSVEVWDGRRGITNKCIIRWEFLARAFSSVFSTVFRSEFGRYLVAVGSRIGRKVENSGRNLGKIGDARVHTFALFRVPALGPPRGKAPEIPEIGKFGSQKPRPDDYQARLYSYIVIL